MTSQSSQKAVVHPISPIFNSKSRVLILGTMPSPASREAMFYYAHPQNRFWRVLAALFDAPVPHSNDDRRTFAISHQIAIWDVLASCEISGASDASIRNPRPNDLSLVFDAARISTVFTTGTKAAALYDRFDAPKYPNIGHIALPSTSAANAKMSFDALVLAYQPLLNALQ